VGKNFFDLSGNRIILTFGARKSRNRNYEGMFRIRNMTFRKAEQIANSMFGRVVAYGMYSSFR